MRAQTSGIISGLVAASLLVGASLGQAGSGQDDETGALQRQAARIAGLVGQLGDDDYKTRESATEELSNLGESARSQLEAATRSEDSEVRWRAKMLLNRLDDSKPGKGRARELREERRDDLQQRRFRDRRPGGDFDDLRSELEEMMRRFHREFSFGPDSLRPFDELDKRLQDALKRPLLSNDDWLRELERGFRFEPGQGDARTETQFQGSLQIKKNGNSLDLEVDQDGKLQGEAEIDGEKIPLEADRLEDLEELQPRVWDEFGLGSIQPTVPGFSFKIGPIDPRLGLAPEGSPLPKEKRLGVLLADIPEALRSHLGLEAAQGVLIEEVEVGSSAEKLGLERHDVILSFNGAEIESVEDLRAAYQSLSPGNAIEVSVVRRAQRQTLAGQR